MSSVNFPAGFDPDTSAEHISDLWTSWNTGRQVWLERVREVIQYVYATSTRETTAGKNPWSHSTHIPKLTQIHDNLAANYAAALFGGKEWFKFDARDQESARASRRKAIEEYLRTKHDYSGFNNVALRLLQDWVQTGNCFAKVRYDYQTRADDQEVVYEGPVIERISPYDIVFDYKAAKFEDAPCIIRRVLSRGDLLRMVEEQPDAGWDVSVIEKAIQFRTLLADYSTTEINKHIQREYDGFSDAGTYFGTDEVEVLEFYGDIFEEFTDEFKRDQWYVVIDRRWVLRRGDYGTLDGNRHIYHCGWRDRPDNLWAQGPLDNLVGMQYLIDHLENARADAFDQMLSPDRVHIGNVQIEQDGPVTNYYIDDGNGTVTNLAPDATALQADFQIQTKEAQMEAYAGAPREAMGLRSPGEKTAFEVQQLASAASRLFQHKIEQFEREFLEKVLNAELEVAVRNLNYADTIKTIDDDLGVEVFEQITAEDLTARGKIKARGASHFAKRAQMVQELQQFGNVLAADPELRVHFPAKPRAKAWAEALGFDDKGLFEEYGALNEQAELQQKQQAVQRTVEESQATEIQLNEQGLV